MNRILRHFTILIPKMIDFTKLFVYQWSGLSYAKNTHKNSLNFRKQSKKRKTKNRRSLEGLRSEPPSRSQHSAKFTDHKSYKSGDIYFFQFVAWHHVRLVMIRVEACHNKSATFDMWWP